MRKNLLIKTAVALALATPLLASAESQFVVGTGAASARLNFQVIIPRVLFLGVGTGAGTGVLSTLSTNTTINELAFDYTTNATALGTGAAAGSITNTGGFANNQFPVRVFGNNGQITLRATGADLSNGSETIPITQITGTSSDPTNLPNPGVGVAAGVTVPFSAGNKVTDQSATWTFSYANTGTIPAAGAYTSLVTYTASMP